jgi:DNA-binding XRE family transcriptional regulator
MRRFKDHLQDKLRNEEFRQLFEEERELLELSLKVVDARKQRGLSQKELSEKAHVTQQQISKIETGVNCNMVTFLKVCHALGIKVDLGEAHYKSA